MQSQFDWKHQIAENDTSFWYASTLEYQGTICDWCEKPQGFCKKYYQIGDYYPEMEFSDGQGRCLLEDLGFFYCCRSCEQECFTQLRKMKSRLNLEELALSRSFPGKDPPNKRRKLH